MTDYNNHEYLYSLLALFLSGCDCHQILNLQTKYSSLGMTLITIGTGHMILMNVVYGIAGSIAVIGMTCVGVGVALLLDSGDQFPEIDVWNFWILQIFFGSIYTFAGIAKLDDDWLSGSTLTELCQTWTGPTALQPLLEEMIEREWPIKWVAYGGMLFDLLVPFGLVFPHPVIRVSFALAAVGFHLMNHFTFVIETFPWLMLFSLVIYFDSSWISSLYRIVQALHHSLLSPFHRLSLSALSLSKWFSLLFLSLLLSIHLLIPLPCALDTLHGQETVNYSSQCQFFSWRMMTRTSKLFTLIVYLKNQKTKEVDSVLLNQFNLSPEDIALISMHEDYLFKTAQQIKAMALPSSSSQLHSPPVVTADIWLQINGPPIQRYVNPAMDLSLDLVTSPSSSSPSSLSQHLSSLLHKSSSYPWLEERISEFRTPFWKNILRNISKYETQVAQMNNPAPSFSETQLLYFADRSGSERTFSVYLRELALFRVLSGHISVQGVGVISEGHCALLKGSLHLTVASPVGLWMIRDRDHNLVVLPKYVSTNQYPALKVQHLYSCPLHSASSRPPPEELKRGDEMRSAGHKHKVDL
jgi:hypothetical protein